jgi:hypothetical protein
MNPPKLRRQHKAGPPRIFDGVLAQGVVQMPKNGGGVGEMTLNVINWLKSTPHCKVCLPCELMARIMARTDLGVKKPIYTNGFLVGDTGIEFISLGNRFEDTICQKMPFSPYKCPKKATVIHI